jgi:uncharacterized protein
MNARRLSTLVPSRAAARLRAFRRDVELALPGKVARVVLFGSRARGEARRDSDYDVAVFVRGLDRRRLVDHTLADIAYQHILAGFHIRPVAVPAEYLENPPQKAFAMEVARDGVVVT